jgi:hypothetical protein
MKNQKRFHGDAPKRFVKVELPHPWYSESNVVKAGESAFGIGVRFYNNPFKLNPFRQWWIRGFKRAEKNYNEAVRYSMKVQETIALEEVEA